MVIRSEAWQLDNFRANPVIFSNHDYGTLPIGRAVHVDVEDGRLVVDVVFDRDDELAATIERKVRNGFLNAVSVGWQTLDMRDVDETGKKLAAPEVTAADLWEVSVVGVPSDTGAIKQSAAQAALVGARQAVAELEAALTEEEDVEARVAQKVRDELDALTGTRKGAVLSRKNIEGLEAARDAIDAVLASAGKPEEAEVTVETVEEERAADDAFVAVLAELARKYPTQPKETE